MGDIFDEHNHVVEKERDELQKIQSFQLIYTLVEKKELDLISMKEILIGIGQKNGPLTMGTSSVQKALLRAGKKGMIEYDEDSTLLKFQQYLSKTNLYFEEIVKFCHIGENGNTVRAFNQISSIFGIKGDVIRFKNEQEEL